MDSIKFNDNDYLILSMDIDEFSVDEGIQYLSALKDIVKTDNIILMPKGFEITGVIHDYRVDKDLL